MALCLWLTSLVASGQPAPNLERARRLFASGVQLADAGRDREALAAFEGAYEASPHFAVLYNIARIQMKLGETEKALDTLQRYLESGAEKLPGARRRWAETTIQRLRSVTRATEHGAQAAELHIECPWHEFEVSLDSRSIGRTPFSGSLFLPLGRHTLAFRRPGYVSTPTVLMLPPDGDEFRCHPTPLDPVPPALAAHVRLKLEPRWASAFLDGRRIPVSTSVPAGRHTLTLRANGYLPRTTELILAPGQTQSLGAELRPIAVAPKPGSDPIDTPYRRVGVALAVSGLAWAATGTAILLWNDQRYHEWEREDWKLRETSAMGEPPAGSRISEHNSLLDSVHRFDVAGWSTLAVGGACLATGLVLSVWRASPNETAVNLRPSANGLLLDASW